MFSKKTLSVFVGLIVWLLVSYFLEPFIDRIIGNNDGNFVYLHYINFALICLSLIYACTRIHENIAKFFFPVLSILFTIWVIEFACFVLNSKPKHGTIEPDMYVNGEKGKYFNKEDSLLGARAIGNAVVEFKDKGRILFKYTFDSIGFRTTIPFSSITQGKKKVFFYGCSFTMGYYLSDSSTICSLYSQRDTNNVVLNYGFNGYGTQQLLSMLQHNFIMNSTAESNAIMFYIYLDDHIRRTIIDMVKLNSWEENWPYYKLEKNGYVFYKNLKQANYLRYALYKFLRKSEFFKCFGITLPLFITAKDYAYVAGIIDEERKLYSKIFKNDNFYVIVYPSSHNNIISDFKRLGIKYFDYSNILDMKQAKFQTPGSFHPSALAHQIVLDSLFKDLAK